MDVSTKSVYNLQLSIYQARTPCLTQGNISGFSESLSASAYLLDLCAAGYKVRTHSPCWLASGCFSFGETLLIPNTHHDHQLQTQMLITCISVQSILPLFLCI